MVEAGLSRSSTSLGPGRAARLARRAIAPLVWIPANALGLAALTSPAWATSQHLGAALAPLALAALVTLSAAALVLEASSGELGARRVAAVGALAAIAGALRFLETVVPGPAGFSPVFFPVIVGGYVFGARFGFLTGATTMLVSAVVTGGVGPWLPAQTLITGWVGMSAGWLPGGGIDSCPTGRRHMAAIVAFGAAWGMLYGLLLTPWSWLLFDGTPALGESGNAAVQRMAAFYVSTSAAWDAFRAAGNALLLAIAGPPVIRALRRLGRRLVADQPSEVWRDRIGTAARHDLRREQRRPAARRGAVVRGRTRAAATATATSLDRVADGTGPGEAGWGVGPARRGQAAVDGSPRGVVRVRGAVGASPAVVGPSMRGFGGNRAPASRRRARRSRAAIRLRRPMHREASRDLPALVWVAWLAVVAVIASSTRNPVLLACLLAAIAVVRSSVDTDHEAAFSAPVGRIALLVLPLSTLYGLLALHAGDHVLARLPRAWPVVGGSLTLEGLVYGASTGMVLLSLLAAFSTAHRALGSRGLVRLLPRAFASLDLAAVVALAHLPMASRLAIDAREAWRVRGGAAAGPSTWRHLAVPVFSGGLERSLQLAESLAVRGLAAVSGPSPFARLLLAGSLVLVTGGWLATAAGRVTPRWGAAVALVGLLLALLVVATAARKAPRTDHRAIRWSGFALAAVALSGLALAAAALPAGRTALAWSPFPSLATPVVDPLLILALGLMAAPAAAVRGRVVQRAPGATARPCRGAPAAAPIRASGLGYQYPEGRRPAFWNLSFELAAASLHVVAGPSGSGKSTLLRTMAGLVPHFTGGLVAGRLDVAGLNPIALGPTGVAGHIGIVSGDPDSAFVMDTVEDEVAYALESRAMPADRMAHRVRTALRDVGMWGARDRSIRTLSGGERQRVAIAAALALEPSVLLLDEPTSQLDDHTATEVLDVVQGLSRRRGTTVVLSEHRLDRVLHRAASVLWLGPSVDPGDGAPYAAVRRSAREPACRSTREAPGRQASPAPTPSPRRRCRLEARALSYAYADRTVLRDVTVQVRQGEIVALTGASGCGKSTLLRLVVGLLRPASGWVHVDDRPVGGPDRAVGFEQIAYLPQDPDVLLLADTVAQELDLTLRARGRPPLDGHRHPCLDRLGLAGMELAHPRDISTGERLRVALAAVTVAGAGLLVLDEPTRGLDADSARALGDLLRGYAADGAGVLVATHDRRILACADRILLLERGRLHERPPQREPRPRRALRPSAVPGPPDN